MCRQPKPADGSPVGARPPPDAAPPGLARPPPGAAPAASDDEVRVTSVSRAAPLPPFVGSIDVPAAPLPPLVRSRWDTRAPLAPAWLVGPGDSPADSDPFYESDASLDFFDEEFHRPSLAEYLDRIEFMSSLLAPEYHANAHDVYGNGYYDDDFFG